jgi:hypothetical protein
MTPEKAKKPGRRGRPRSGNLTPFGKWLDAAGADRAEAAGKLGINRSYLDKLARGAAVPTTLVMWDIHTMTMGKVSLAEWVPVARKLAKSK